MARRIKWNQTQSGDDGSNGDYAIWDGSDGSEIRCFNEEREDPITGEITYYPNTYVVKLFQDQGEDSQDFLVAKGRYPKNCNTTKSVLEFAKKWTEKNTTSNLVYEDKLIDITSNSGTIKERVLIDCRVSRGLKSTRNGGPGKFNSVIGIKHRFKCHNEMYEVYENRPCKGWRQIPNSVKNVTLFKWLSKEMAEDWVPEKWITRHGGKRDGAGRPQKYDEGPTKQISITLPESLLKRITDDIEIKRVSRSEFIANAAAAFLDD